MAAYRQVILTLPEMRARDFLLVDSKSYKVIEWQFCSFITKSNFLGGYRLTHGGQLTAKLQRIDLDDDYAKLGQPIHVVVGKADALQVLVPISE